MGCSANKGREETEGLEGWEGLEKQGVPCNSQVGKEDPEASEGRCCEEAVTEVGNLVGSRYEAVCMSAMYGQKVRVVMVVLSIEGGGRCSQEACWSLHGRWGDAFVFLYIGPVTPPPVVPQPLKSKIPLVTDSIAMSFKLLPAVAVVVMGILWTTTAVQALVCARPGRCNDGEADHQHLCS